MTAQATIFSAERLKAFLVLADQALVSGTAFGTTLLAAKLLTASAFGYYSSIMLGQLFWLAMQNALLTSPYTICQANFKGAFIQVYFQSVVGIQVVFVLVAWVATVAFLSIQTNYFVASVKIGWWSAAAVTGYLLQDVLRRLFIANGEVIRAFVIDLLGSILQGASLLLLWHIGRFDLEMLMKVIALTFLPSLMVGWYWVGISKKAIRTMKEVALLHSRQARWLLPTALLQWCAGNAYLVAAAVQLNAQLFSSIRVTQNLFGVLNVVLLSCENYILPKGARIAKQSTANLNEFVQKLTLRTALFSAPVIFLVVWLVKPLSKAMGIVRYLPDASISWWFAVLYLFLFVGYPVRVMIRVLQLDRAFFTGYLLSTLLSLSTAGYLTRHWLVNGVMAGMLFSQVFLIGYWLLILNRKKTIPCI